MTSCPSRASSAAATDESTPPDMATTIRMAIRPAPSRAGAGCAACRRRRQLRRRRSPPRPRCCPAPRLKRIEFCVRVRRQAHRAQHVRRLERARRAGRAGRDRDALEIERNQQRLGLDRLEADVRRVRDARLAGAVDGGARHLREDRLLEAIAQGRQPRAPRPSASSAASCAATPRPAMPGTFSVPARRLRSCLPPVMDRGDAGAALDPQRAGSLRPVELVRGQRQQIDAERVDVHRDLADRLHGVGMEQRPALVRDARRARRSAGWCRSRCWRASPRRGRSRRVIAAASASGSTMPGGVDRQQGGRPAAPRQGLERVQHRLVLDAAGDRCRRPVGSSASATPRSAKLSASVPPLVNTTSDGSPPISAATAERASSSTAFARWPKWCTLEALPKSSVEHASHGLGDCRDRPGSSRCGRSRCASRIHQS